MSAYDVFFAGLDLTLHGPDDFLRNLAGPADEAGGNPWRRRITVTIAIVLWLLTWLGGWWLSRMLSSGAFVWTMAGACLGWLVGLGIATLFLYLDERL